MIRILLVDDQNLVRQGIKLLLEQDEEFKVIGMVKDGKSAIEQINFLHPDIVLLDIEMPGMNGISITKYINYFFPHTKVIILSSHENKKYLIQALVAGARSYILKSSLMTDLKDAILAVDRGYSQIESRLLAKVLNSGNIKSSSAKSHASNFQNANRHPTKKATDKVKPHSISAIETNTVKQTIDVAKVSDVSNRAELKSNVKPDIESEQKTKIQLDDGSYLGSNQKTELIQTDAEPELEFEPIVKALQSNKYYLDEPSYREQIYNRSTYALFCMILETPLLQTSIPYSSQSKEIGSNHKTWQAKVFLVKNYLQQLGNKLEITKLKTQITQFAQQAKSQYHLQISWCFKKVQQYKSRWSLFIGQRNIQKLLWNFGFMIFGGIIVLILH